MTPVWRQAGRVALGSGLILPVTFAVSFFNDSVGVYATRNSRHLYDLGFVLGGGGFRAPGFLSRHRARPRARDRF